MGGYDGVEAGVRPLVGSRLVIEALRAGERICPEGLSLAHCPGPNGLYPSSTGARRFLFASDWYGSYAT